MPETEGVSATVPLSWDEVDYTSSPLVSVSNVDQDRGWRREVYKKIGVTYGCLRSRREHKLYLHYIHNVDNLSASATCSRQFMFMPTFAGRGYSG